MQKSEIKQTLEKILQQLAQTTEEVNSLLEMIEKQEQHEDPNSLCHVDLDFNKGIDPNSVIV